MKPTKSYVLSAFLFSMTLSLFVGYPSAALFKSAQWAPDFKLWFIMSFFLTSSLTTYSSLKKSTTLLTLNWLVIITVCLAFAGTCWLYNPKAVSSNAGWMVFFCIFTFGGPFWLVIISFIYHCKKCGAVLSPNA